jgi:prepilin-type N-terminal cleavage/methylation domain-containing protein
MRRLEDGRATSVCHAPSAKRADTRIPARASTERKKGIVGFLQPHYNMGNFPHPCSYMCTSPKLHPRTGSGFTLIELLVVITIIAILAGLLLPVVNSVMNNAHKTEAKSTEMQIVSAVKNYYAEYGQYPVVAQSPSVDVTFDNTSTTAGGGSATGLYGHNVILFNVLRAINNVSGALTGTAASYVALNSRQIVYFESKDVKTVSHAVSGFIPAGATGVKGNAKNTHVVPVVGDLVDPWGNLYYVRIDANYSGMVENPYQPGTTDSGSSISYPAATDPSTITDYTTIIRTDVIAWSPGIDGYEGTNTNGTYTLALPPTSDDVVSWQ